MHVRIDADGCPVVREAAQIANEAQVPCTVYCDTAHEFTLPGVRTVIVSKGADSADFTLCGDCVPGDIVVTQDYGLAALCLTRGCRVLNQDGREYTQENIDSLLFFRAYARKVRESGGRLKGPRKRQHSQTEAFQKALRAFLETPTDKRPASAD